MRDTLRKYGEAATFDFSLYEVDGVDLRVDAVHASGDSTVMKNEGAPANTTNGFVDEGDTYSITLTATEMECARGVIKFVDQTTTKVWLDITLEFDTYGHASAQHETFPTDVISVAGTAQTANDNSADINTILSRIIGTLLTGNHNPQSGDAFSRIGVAGAGLTNIDLPNQIMNITGDLSGSVGSVTGAVETDSASRTASQATGFSTHSAADIWTVATRSLTTFGTLIADIWANVTRTLTAGTKDSEIDLIKAVTDVIPNSGAMTSIAQASVVTELRLAELDPLNLPTDIGAIPTTPMRGTEGAALAVDLTTHDNNLAIVDGHVLSIPTVVPDPAGTAATLHGVTDGKIDAVQTDITAMEINITEILDYEAGDWEITNDQMIFKTKLGATLATYDLTKAGVPDSDSPDKRIKV